MSDCRSKRTLENEHAEAFIRVDIFGHLRCEVR